MAIKKSELYSSLWRSCDELRGGMDASQYKDLFGKRRRYALQPKCQHPTIHYEINSCLRPNPLAYRPILCPKKA